MGVIIIAEAGVNHNGSVEIAKEMINEAKKAIEILGGTIEKINEFNLPQSDIGRTVITIRKNKQTPSKYPRKPGTPSKEPIK